jgi:acyl carrier protein
LGEIENHLKTHPGVKDVVVISREERDRQYLCAYFTVAEPSEPAAFSGHRLKGYLEGKLPGYMVPACFVKMEKIPLNINGKIDRKMLPQPLESDFHSTGTYEAPQTNMQQLIAETWKEVLGREKVGVRDNFFDLGGSSLDFVTISNQLKEKLGKEIPVVTLFTYPTVCSLEHFLIGGQEQGEDDLGLIDEGKDLMHLTLNKLDNGD